MLFVVNVNPVGLVSVSSLKLSCSCSSGEVSKLEEVGVSCSVYVSRETLLVQTIITWRYRSRNESKGCAHSARLNRTVGVGRWCVYGFRVSVACCRLLPFRPIDMIDIVDFLE